MCQYCQKTPLAFTPLARRNVLKFAAAAAAALALSGGALAKDSKMVPPPKPQNVLSPDAALDRLMNGNKRYVDGLTKRHNFAHEREALTKGQNPFAAVLGCADSRIAAEFCFDTALGDVFVCRVAGNFANDDIIASLEYAVAVLKTPLIMVMGHDACGAVDATIKSIKDGTTLPGHLPELVSAIRPAVEAVKNQGGDMLANAISSNVKLNVDKLQKSSPILDAAVNGKTLRVVGGVYRLASGKVDLI
ncbi:MAG TPA: carbonic anhydrase [Xanthobacteraceae bacterium]|jgi:carbonic anhydrase|nr:carbonic anhydrase [Xanthobacteraceae bacterium]